jgi:hypothetical protein
VEVVFEFDSIADYWYRFRQISGVGPKLAGLSTLDFARIRNLLQQGVAPYRQGEKIRLTAWALAAMAARADTIRWASAQLRGDVTPGSAGTSGIIFPDRGKPGS